MYRQQPPNSSTTSLLPLNIHPFRTYYSPGDGFSPKGTALGPHLVVLERPVSAPANARPTAINPPAPTRLYRIISLCTTPPTLLQTLSTKLPPSSPPSIPPLAVALSLDQSIIAVVEATSSSIVRCYEVGGRTQPWILRVGDATDHIELVETDHPHPHPHPPIPRPSLSTEPHAQALKITRIIWSDHPRNGENEGPPSSDAAPTPTSWRQTMKKKMGKALFNSSQDLTVVHSKGVDVYKVSRKRGRVDRVVGYRFLQSSVPRSSFTDSPPKSPVFLIERTGWASGGNDPLFDPRSRALVQFTVEYVSATAGSITTAFSPAMPFPDVPNSRPVLVAHVMFLIRSTREGLTTPVLEHTQLTHQNQKPTAPRLELPHPGLTPPIVLPPSCWPDLGGSVAKLTATSSHVFTAYNVPYFVFLEPASKGERLVHLYKLDRVGENCNNNNSPSPPTMFASSSGKSTIRPTVVSHQTLKVSFIPSPFLIRS